MLPDVAQTPSVSDRFYPFAIQGINLITTLAAPIFLSLGAAIGALHLATPFKATFSIDPVATALLAGGLMVLGTALYLKNLWEASQKITAAENALAGARIEKKPAENLLKDHVVETIDIEGERYERTGLRFGGGDIKDLYLGFDKENNPVAISVAGVGENDSKRKFWVLPQIIEGWQKAAQKGGVGQILGHKTTKNKQYLVQKLYNGSSLYDQLGRLSHGDRVRVGKEVLQGLLNLEAEGLCHGEVKAQNIQVYKDKDGLHAVLVDADLSVFIEDTGIKGVYEEKLKCKGAPLIWPPEMAFEEGRSGLKLKKVQSWSFGIILAMLFIKNPHIVKTISGYGDSVELKLKRSTLETTINFYKEDLLVKSNPIDPKFAPIQPILDKLLEPDPEKRATLEEVKEELETFFAVYNKEAAS